MVTVVTSSIDRIADALEKSSGQCFGYDILTTLPSALLAAIAAIAAAKATIYFQNRSIRVNVEKAIKLEIYSIAEEIKRCISLDNRNAAIDCEIVRLRNGATPVYIGNSHHLAMLNDHLAKLIFIFYNNFMTVPRAGDENKFLKSDLNFVINSAKNITEN